MTYRSAEEEEKPDTFDTIERDYSTTLTTQERRNRCHCRLLSCGWCIRVHVPKYIGVQQY